MFLKTTTKYLCNIFIFNIAMNMYVYRIAGNFHEKYDFCGENFCGLLAFAASKNATPQTFTKKTLANSHKTVKFA